jgi:anti-anti-sigma regulatory factor
LLHFYTVNIENNNIRADLNSDKDAKNMEENEKIWHFPDNIELEFATALSQKVKDMKFNRNEIIFDLSNITRAHSSFIGFLIHMKFSLENSGKKFILLTSPYLDTILEMLCLNEVFMSNKLEAAKEAVLV